MISSPDSTSRPVGKRPLKVTGQTVAVQCPQCQFQQQVRPEAVSMFCDQCHTPIEVQDILHPKIKPKKAQENTVPITCPHCHGEQQVRADGVSVFCKACHNQIQIQDVLHPKAQGKKSIEHTVPIKCTQCQHEQQVRPDGVSVFCKVCHNQIRIQDVLHPKEKVETKVLEGRSFICIRCETELTAPLKALSGMCKKCGNRNDLQDYHVKNVFSRDLETQGSLIIDAGGTVLNSTSKVKEAVIWGKFIGKLIAQKEVLLKEGSHFEGDLKAESIQIESHVECTIKNRFQVKRIVIAGQYCGNIRMCERVELKKNSCFSGSLTALNLVVEEGASVYGHIKIGAYAHEEETSNQRPQDKDE